jgi:glycosyltransferase involved in cell wall biosynthesis
MLIESSPRSTHTEPARAIRVGVDTTGIYVTQAGIARHVRGLLKGFHAVEAPDISTFPIAWEVENFGYKQPMRTLRTIYREFIWGKLAAPRILKQQHADLLHSTSSLFMRVPRGTQHLVTLHDMSISRHPERFRPWQVKSWHRRLKVILNADRVITISKFTADEAHRLIGLDLSKVDVVHNGCDFHPDEPRPAEAAPNLSGVTNLDGSPVTAIPSEFFFFVGSLEPGKNLKLLKAAYLQAESEGKPLPPLVILGARWQGVATEGDQPRGWIYLGRQEDDVLVWLYRRALALMFPSIYEGFGLPIVEAMALDCPAVCSPASSLTEVAGDGALLVEMTHQAYLNAMRRITGPGGPALREELIARGRRRALDFSWSNCARKTFDVYRHMMGRSA